MDAPRRSGNDRALLGALTDLVSEFRSRQLDATRPKDSAAVRGGTDRLARTLATHLQYTEETLFPALRRLKPGAATALEGMERSHWPLRSSARDLSARVRIDNDEESHRLARTLLATVMEHVTGETAAVEDILGTLEEEQYRTLNRQLSERP